MVGIEPVILFVAHFERSHPEGILDDHVCKMTFVDFSVRITHDKRAGRNPHEIHRDPVAQVDRFLKYSCSFLSTPGLFGT